MGCVPYYEMRGLENVYFEDSYVLDLLESANSLMFELKVVLTEKHPLYHAPKPDEQYCYRKAALQFESVSRVVWLERDLRQSTDANGETDYGNIDAFYADKETYHLEGDWGIVEINSAPPSLRFD